MPSRVPIGRARRDGVRTTYEPVEPEARPLAFLGVRGCELAGLRVQDRVLMEGPVADPDYAARRRAALVIAVECTVAGATCFCTSMGTGPAVGPAFAPLGVLVLSGPSSAGPRGRAGLSRAPDLYSNRVRSLPS